MTVYETTDYAQFKQMIGNRQVNEKHVARLIKSIDGFNMLESFPIVVNASMEVIDGQHRLEAAKQLKLPVYYVITNGDLSATKVINTNTKGWTINDFVESYITQDNPYYAELDKFSRTYDIPYSLSAELLMSLAGTKSRSTLAHIKSGTFVVNRPKTSTEIGGQLVQLKPYCDFKVTNRNLIRALIRLHTNGDFKFDRFMAKIKTHGLRLQRRAGVDYMVLHIEEIYNFQSKQPVTLFRAVPGKRG